jgi:D-erythro-7,8-dihydroneopterin triphosphate epimerase
MVRSELFVLHVTLTLQVVFSGLKYQIKKKMKASQNKPSTHTLVSVGQNFAPRKRVLASTAKICISNLRLRTLIGFNPDERTKKQDVIVNINVTYRTNPGIYDDVVESALNYKTITKRVIACVEEGRFLLLEKLVGDVLDICAEHEDVTAASVRIDKPHALRFADSVSLEMQYST